MKSLNGFKTYKSSLYALNMALYNNKMTSIESA